MGNRPPFNNGETLVAVAHEMADLQEENARLRRAIDALREGHEEILAGLGMPEEISEDAIIHAAKALKGNG